MERILERLRKLRADVEAWLGTLAPRERVMVTVAAFAVALFTLWLVVHQIGAGVSAREARIEQKTKVLSQIGKLAEGYRRRAAERQMLDARLKAPVQLMSHISQAGTTLGIQVNDLRPTGAPVESEGGLREESVEVNLARIEMQKLGLLMQSLERGAGVVKIRRIRLTTRNDDPALVDATLVVSTFHPKS